MSFALPAEYFMLVTPFPRILKCHDLSTTAPLRSVILCLFIRHNLYLIQNLGDSRLWDSLCVTTFHTDIFIQVSLASVFSMLANLQLLSHTLTNMHAHICTSLSTNKIIHTPPYPHTHTYALILTHTHPYIHKQIHPPGREAPSISSA